MSEIRNVEQYFSRAASSFDSLYRQEKATPFARFLNRNFRRDIYERFILSLNHVRRHGLTTVLDVGCGSGRYAYAMAKLGVRRIVGIDVSPAMVELARSLTREVQSSQTSLEFVCGDFMEFETRETFDVVLTMGFFDYVEEPLPVLKRMGHLADHSVIASFPSNSWYRTPIRRVRYYFKRCPVYFYEREKIEWLSAKSKFAASEIKKIEGAGQDYYAAFYRNCDGHGQPPREQE